MSKQNLPNLSKALNGLTIRVGEGKPSKTSSGPGKRKVKKESRTPRPKSSSKVRPKPSKRPSFVRDADKVESTFGRIETINVQINPFHLWQFVFGFVSSTSKLNDSPLIQNTIPQVTANFIWNMKDPLYSALQTWPKQLLKLAAHLRARKIGNYSYVPDWSAVDNQVSYLTGTAGRLGAYTSTGSTVVLVDNTATPVNGAFPDVTSTYILPTASVGSGNNSTIREWMSMFSDYLDLVNISDIDKFDSGSGSAFCFASEEPIVSFPTSSPQEVVVAFQSGFVAGTSNSPSYLLHNGSSGSETRIPRDELWMAELRLGTWTVNILPELSPNSVNPRRRINYSVPCYASPGLIGYCRFNKVKSPRVQVKLIPSGGLLQAIINKIEFAGSIIGPTYYSSLGSNDVRYYAYFLLKHMLGRYSGSLVGTCVRFAANSSPIPAEPSQYHMNDFVLDSVRLSEPISDLIGAATSFSNSRITVLPLVNPISPNLGVTSGSYTGTPVVPTLPSQGYSFVSPVDMGTIVSKFKSIESLFAQVSVMRYMSQYGPSLLDATVLRNGVPPDNYAQTVLSCRPITDKMMGAILNNMYAISYAASATSLSFTTTSPVQVNFEQHQHLYAQNNYKILSGMVPLNTYININQYEGWVRPGTLVTNISGNDSPEGGEHLMTPFERVEHATKDGLTQGLGLFWDNYCGYNWSAGQRGGKPPMRNGKYLAPPLSREDQACKEHDEAYYHANGNKLMIKEADAQFVKSLRKIEKAGDLSFKGKLAKEFFDTSMAKALGRDSPSV